MSWTSELWSDVHVMLYSVEEPGTCLHPPKNKGHEALVYLTYLVDFYDTFSSHTLFMHAHRYAYHNNKALGLDAIEIIKRLDKQFLNEQGYVNLHCSLDMGCPTWLKPHENGAPLGMQEQDVLAKCWRELYHYRSLPVNLAQPCCGQFALSRDRVRGIRLEELVYLRDWLLRTPLTDYFSGRIWEYLWHFLFLQKDVHCLDTKLCLCRGYQVCVP